MILYFSGTGNSKYAAQRIADGLGDTLCSMNEPVLCGTGCSAQSCTAPHRYGSS